MSGQEFGNVVQPCPLCGGVRCVGSYGSEKYYCRKCSVEFHFCVAKKTNVRTLKVYNISACGTLVLMTATVVVTQ